MKWLKVLLILLIGVSVYAAGNLLSSNCSVDAVENMNIAITEAAELLSNVDAKSHASAPQDLNSQLLDACAEGKQPADVVQRIIDNGRNGRARLNINVIDEGGWTPLMYAAAAGSAEKVRLLLQQPDIDVQRTGNNYSALMLASMEGHENVVDVFIGHPNKLAQTINQEISFTTEGKTLRYTALSWACVKKYDKIVEKLRGKNAKDPDNLCGCSGY